MSYSDVLIEVSAQSTRRDHFIVRVVHAEAGALHVSDAAPFTIDRQQLLDDLARLRQRGMLAEQLRAFGRRLAGWLLPSAQQNASTEARDVLRRQLAQVSASQRRDKRAVGMRLRLRLPPALVDVPWEYLYVDDSTSVGLPQGFLALDPRMAIVRDEGLDDFIQPPEEAVSSPIACTVALTSPAYDDLPALDLSRERMRIEQVFERRGAGDPPYSQVIERGTLAALEQPLRTTHIFHFVGHNKFTATMVAPPLADGWLALHDQWLSAAQLRQLTANSSLRLVVLDGCEAGQQWSAVATALIFNGVPAVLASQLPITDDCAIAFYRQIYHSLRDGTPITHAVADGRRAAYHANPQGHDWGSPVLYMRSASGTAVLREGQLAEPRPALPVITSMRAPSSVAHVRAVATAPSSTTDALPRRALALPAISMRRDTNLALIGREHELHLLATKLHEPHVRSVLLSGPAGVGKTALALHAATTLAHRFGDGIVAIELSAARSASQILAMLADALGARGTVNAAGLADDAGVEVLLNSICGHIGDRHILLIFDTFDHLLHATEHILDLLMCCENVKLILTSRGEVPTRMDLVYQVPPLAIEPATQLFLQCARAVVPNVRFDDQQLPCVAMICEQLDCLPLAIELAAPWLKIYALEQLQQELGLHLLRQTTHDRPERQRSMDNTLTWSYELLNESEQQLFVHLAVFDGPFTLNAARAVVAHDNTFATALKVLIERSLLLRTQQPGAEPQFVLPKLVRAYALERLEQNNIRHWLQQRHVDYYLNQTVLAEPLSPPELARWTQALQGHYKNIRAALEYALDDDDADAALQFVGALCPFWMLRGLIREGFTLAERALACNNAALPVLRARALLGVGQLALRQERIAAAEERGRGALALFQQLSDAQGTGDAFNLLGECARLQGTMKQAQEWYEQSLAQRRACEDVRGVAATLSNLGLTLERHDRVAARHRYQESLSLSRVIGYDLGAAASLTNLGTLSLAEGDYAVAETLFTESLALYAQLGDQVDSIQTLRGLGSAAYNQYDFPKARGYYEQSLARAKQLADDRNALVSHADLGLVAFAQGRLREAAPHYARALALCAHVGDQGRLATLLEQLARLAAQQGRFAQAAGLLGRADAARAIQRDSDNLHQRCEQDEDFKPLAQKLGAAALFDRWQLGRLLAIDRAVTEAFAL